MTDPSDVATAGARGLGTRADGRTLRTVPLRPWCDAAREVLRPGRRRRRGGTRSRRGRLGRAGAVRAAVVRERDAQPAVHRAGASRDRAGPPCHRDRRGPVAGSGRTRHRRGTAGRPARRHRHLAAGAGGAGHRARPRDLHRLPGVGVPARPARPAGRRAAAARRVFTARSRAHGAYRARGRFLRERSPVRPLAVAPLAEPARGRHRGRQRDPRGGLGGARARRARDPPRRRRLQLSPRQSVCPGHVAAPVPPAPREPVLAVRRGALPDARGLPWHGPRAHSRGSPLHPTPHAGLPPRLRAPGRLAGCRVVDDAWCLGPRLRVAAGTAAGPARWDDGFRMGVARGGWRDALGSYADVAGGTRGARGAACGLVERPGLRGPRGLADAPAAPARHGD